MIGGLVREHGRGPWPAGINYGMDEWGKQRDKEGRWDRDGHGRLVALMRSPLGAWVEGGVQGGLVRASWVWG
jgi:hypothetical protein